MLEWLSIATYISVFRFGETSLTYDESAHNTILDYVVKVKTLDESDRIVQYAGTNYSVTGKGRSSAPICLFFL